MKYYKLYKTGLLEYILKSNKLVCYSEEDRVYFFKNHLSHNLKYCSFKNYKFNYSIYYLNNNFIGDERRFKSNKEWRKHLKLLAFI